MDSSLPDSSVYGILQARILERVAMPSSREYSLPASDFLFLLTSSSLHLGGVGVRSAGYWDLPGMSGSSPEGLHLRHQIQGAGGKSVEGRVRAEIQNLSQY